MYKKVRNQRMQGNLYAVGLFGGYSWELNYRWNMSADLGLHVGWYDAKVYECGHCGTYKGKDDDSFLMPKLGVNIIYKFGKKPEKTIEPIKPVAPNPMEYMSYQKFRPALSKVEDNRGKAGLLELDNPVLQHISQYKPYVSSRILRKEKGALYVYFPLDKTELRRDFRDNAATLDKIVSIVDEVLADTTSDVKIIQIVGMASIEGAESHNQQLGQGRADALKDYIINHSNATEPLFDVANGGEAWSEFRDQVNDESFDGKAEILAIIDGSDTPAAKERKIKALNGGKTYQYLKENILKDQRNSGYIRIYYDYVPDVNMGIIKEGIDLTVKKNYKQAIDLLKEGQVNCVVECTPNLGDEIMRVAKDLAAGKEVQREVYRFGAGLQALGVRRGDNMALLSEGRNLWIISELAMFYAGAVNVPLSIKLEEAGDLLFRQPCGTLHQRNLFLHRIVKGRIYRRGG